MTTPPLKTVPDPAGHDPAHGTAEAGDFRPVCPECAYDLSGLPDGPCPECGEPFKYVALLAAHRREHQPRPPDNAALMASWTAALLSLLIPALQPKAITIAFAAALSGLWAIQHRKELRRTRDIRALYLQGVVVSIGGVASPDSGFARLLFVVGLVVFTYLATRRSKLLTTSWLAGMLCLGLLIVGVPRALSGCAGLARGEHWSNWRAPWPLPLRLHHLFTPAIVMTHREVLVIGLAAIAFTVIPALLCIGALRRHRRGAAGHGAPDPCSTPSSLPTTPF